VTGAAHGIGQAIAAGLAERGTASFSATSARWVRRAAATRRKCACVPGQTCRCLARAPTL